MKFQLRGSPEKQFKKTGKKANLKKKENRMRHSLTRRSRNIHSILYVHRENLFTTWDLRVTAIIGVLQLFKRRVTGQLLTILLY